jgi:hypothetical protein
MLGKQQQNNDVLKRVVDTLELDTFLVLGDHGTDRKVTTMVMVPLKTP